MSDTDGDEGEPLWVRILEFPLVALVIATILFAVASYLADLFLAYQPNMGSSANAVSRAVLTIAMLWVTYKLIISHLGDKPRDDLPLAGAIARGAQGLVIGFLLFSAVVGVAFICGAYRVTGYGGTNGFLINLASFALLPAFGEELLFRGMFFRWIEEFGGSWAALVVTSALFGLAHILNPNATWFSSFAIALEAGVLLGGAYMLTRSLWLPIGLHAAWNFTQGFIFGVPVSGIASNGLVRSELSGPDWLSGGSFGLEASVIALVLATAAGTWMAVQAKKRGLVFGPMWTRPGAIVIAGQKRLA
ncbi:MAG: CPBP family intramembrane metalloprotease [Sphingomonas sp.]|nr:CPBP family intramembrane metalloprotease [Sphingomonas sp.]